MVRRWKITSHQLLTRSPYSVLRFPEVWLREVWDWVWKQKRKLKSTAINVREVMFRKLSVTRAAGFKCTGSGGKCSELVQMENAISRQRIDIIAEKPGAHQAWWTHGKVECSVLPLFEKQPEIPVVLFRLPNTNKLQTYKEIKYSRVFIRYKDTHYLGLLNTYTQLCNFYLFLAKLLKTYHLVRLFILC